MPRHPVVLSCLLLAMAIPVQAGSESRIGKSGAWARIQDGEYLVDLPNRGELNLMEYFAHLLADGTLKQEWFLSSIEAGSEIASGAGEITFKTNVVH